MYLLLYWIPSQIDLIQSIAKLQFPTPFCFPSSSSPSLNLFTNFLFNSFNSIYSLLSFFFFPSMSNTFLVLGILLSLQGVRKGIDVEEMNIYFFNNLQYKVQSDDLQKV